MKAFPGISPQGSAAAAEGSGTTPRSAKGGSPLGRPGDTPAAAAAASAWLTGPDAQGRLQDGAAPDGLSSGQRSGDGAFISSLLSLLGPIAAPEPGALPGLEAYLLGEAPPTKKPSGASNDDDDGLGASLMSPDSSPTKGGSDDLAGPRGIRWPSSAEGGGAPSSSKVPVDSMYVYD